jgi:CRISP-associated protein Cas1
MGTVEKTNPKPAPEAQPDLAKTSRAPLADGAPEYLPARMLNEYAYCPRLGYMMWVQGEFADNVYTEDGRYQHRRVDVESGELPSEADGDAAPKTVRSVMLSSERERMIARVDLVEVEGRRAVPVDYKRSKAPDVPERAYEPERVQLCAQGLILADNGFECDRGVLYFAGSRERVEVAFTEALIARTRRLASDFRAAAELRKIPPPLDASPKCNGCSLVGICLPDETGALMEPRGSARKAPRRLVAPRDDALPVYVQNQGAYVSKSGDVIVIKEKRQKVAEARLFETSHLMLMGNVQISTQTVQELCRRGIPVVYTSYGGWFYGMTAGPCHKNIDLRLRQYRAADDRDQSLALARGFVSAKIRNCRTLLRRNAEGLERPVLDRLRKSARDAENAETVESLLGVEGFAAKVYFGSLPLMIKQNDIGGTFSFEGRNRRPPRDPVNAMLSLAYALLVKDLTVTLTAAGFDPYLGFFHRPRYGRPSLALDLMEELRPIICDSTVIGAINNGVVTRSDFTESGAGVALKSPARKAFIGAFERRMNQTIKHPVFGYEISYRRVLDVQARLLGRHLTGEIPEYPMFLTR